MPPNTGVVVVMKDSMSMHDSFDVSQKTVVITGGLGILGQTFAKFLLTRNAKVVLFDQPENPDLAAVFGSKSLENICYVSVDVRQRHSVERGLALCERRFGGIPDALINSAAIDAPPDAPISENGPFESYPMTSFDRVMDVNVKGSVICCQVIGGAMAKAGRGSIVNISSIYGMVSPNQQIYEYRRLKGEEFFKPVAYSVSKSAIFNMTRYLATYWAKQGVRVNTISFAGVFNNQDESFLKAYCDKIPMGRMARRDEYIGPIVFLISNASSYMTGANLVVDGGWTAW